MKKEKNTNQGLDNQEILKEQRLKLDTLIEAFGEVCTELGMKMEVTEGKGSFVYFPKPKNPLKGTQDKK